MHARVSQSTRFFVRLMACMGGGLLASLALVAEDVPSPPSQPAAGPGGRDYAHAAVSRSRHGKGAREFWLFEPAQPTPESAPLVIFLHSYAATDPSTYGAWIEHLVRRGRTVCYPRYQAGVIPRLDSFTPNAIRAVREAIAILDGPEHVSLAGGQLAVVGHSIGGLMAANLAAAAASENLPAPAAIFAVLPGSVALGAGEFELADLSRIPVGTLLLSLSGDADTVSGSADARRIYLETTGIPSEDKDYLLLLSDGHGHPALEANHLSPLAIDPRYREEADFENGPGSRGSTPNRRADALDFYGTWKLFDGLCDAAFHGTHREHALGNTDQQRFMGVWSDGHPVLELDVKDFSKGPAIHGEG